MVNNHVDDDVNVVLMKHPSIKFSYKKMNALISLQRYRCYGKPYIA